jgi:hypothetical protein
MDKNRSKIFILIYLTIVVAVVLLYILLFRNLVCLAYAGNSPEWFNSLIDFFYPRFIVEKNRFELSFFLQKADQVIIRFSLTITVIFSIYYLYTLEKIKSFFTNYWNQETTVNNIAFLRKLYYIFLIIIFKDIYWDLLSLSKISVFYRPIALYKILHIPIPSHMAILIICLLFFISCTLCIANFKSIFFSVIAVLVFLLIQGYIFSFEKFDHGFATYSYAGMLMPFLLWEFSDSEKKHLPNVIDWVLPLIRLVICLCYFYSGLEKLLISGIEWVQQENFKAHLLIHPTSFGLTVASSNFLCILFAIGTLCFQLGFILVLPFPKLKWLFLSIGIIFHISTYLLMDVGGYLNPWILAYIFFIDWNPLAKFLSKKNL